jgi:hypothetical protein
MTYLISEERGRWEMAFGAFECPVAAAASSVDAVSGVAAAGGWHAETHFFGVVGADFEYSADITWPLLDPLIGNATDAHLQFRISDEGRYGVGVRPASGPDGFDVRCACTDFSCPIDSAPPIQMCSPIARFGPTPICQNFRTSARSGPHLIP